MTDENQTTISETSTEENVATPEAVEQNQAETVAVEEPKPEPEAGQSSTVEPTAPEQAGEVIQPKPEPVSEVVVDPGNTTFTTNSAKATSVEESSVESKPNKVTEIKGDTVTITEVMTPQPPIQEEQPKENIVKKLLKKAKEKIQEKKRNKLNKILVEVQKRGKITNDEVEKFLHVSHATATRYLDQLEKEDKIRQIGKTGKSVHYQKI